MRETIDVTVQTASVIKILFSITVVKLPSKPNAKDQGNHCG